MSPNSENLSLRHPSRRGGMWGFLVLYPFFLGLALQVGQVIGLEVGGRWIFSTNRPLSPMWLWSTGFSLLASAFFGGFRSSERAVLMTVSLFYGLFMSLHSFLACAGTVLDKFETPYLILVLEKCVCAISTMMGLYCVASPENLRKWSKYFLPVWFFLVNALYFNLMTGKNFITMVKATLNWIIMARHRPVDILDLALFLIIWACVPLAWQVQRTTLIERVFPEPPVEATAPADPGEEPVNTDPAQPGTNPRI